MRNIYKKSIGLTKKISQGSIINNCVLDDYDSDVYGLIVTPRCDLSHDGKVTHVHYVPVLNYEDWFKIHGRKYLWEKKKEKLKEKLNKKCIKNCFPFRDNKEAMLKMAQSMQDKKEKEGFESAISNYFGHKDGSYRDYVPDSDSKDTLINNLIENKLPAFQLIEHWSRPHSFAIILLRELKRLEYEVALRLANGFLAEEVDMTKSDLNTSEETVLEYQMLATIDSPYIEHIMERFAHNFYRVGVEDFDRDLVKNTLEKIV